jgi:hypothetical protein
MKFTIHSKTPKGHGKKSDNNPISSATNNHGLHIHRYNGYGGAKGGKANERQ